MKSCCRYLIMLNNFENCCQKILEATFKRYSFNFKKLQRFTQKFCETFQSYVFINLVFIHFSNKTVAKLLRGDIHTHFVTQNLKVGRKVKTYLSWGFVFQRKFDVKRKNIVRTKSHNVRTSVFYLITVLVSCDRRDFKFCRGKQIAEKSSHFTLLQFTLCRKKKEKKLRHTCI